ncbi:hypothetical protein NLI96_g6547 [Meripilus lineatus]|uniref:Amino acid transporter n=1 Tax=Meripilus lineatus TaxID=2056292 RepID=A0AAD5V360_9APHY|nr:hypothetical protein NLI96_g6547 [Physisporinus lineatus]
MSTTEQHKKAVVTNADEALLAQLGYKQEFRRAFSGLETFGIAFSIIGLLPSIASVLFYSIPNGGPSAMVWGWGVASFFILFVGLAMAELASAAPTSGGLYFWTHSLSSPRWRNLLAWICGYSNTIGTIAAIAAINWGCAVQVMAAASIGSNLTFTPTSAQTYGVYAAIILSHALICCLGTQILARLQGIYVFLNIILCLAVIVALPAATPHEYKNSASFALGNFTNCSFDACVHISEEASNASKAVPWAIVGAISIAGILGWAINVSLSFCMGTDLEGIVGSATGQPMAQIFFNSFGRKGTLAIWAIVVITQHMMGSSMVLASSRQAFAFSRDGALPFSRFLYRINNYTKTPVNAVWFVAISAIALGLLVFAGPSAINAVFSIGVTALYIAYSLPILARFLGGNEFKPGPFTLGRFSGVVALIAVLWMSFMFVVFMFPATPETTVEDMNYTIVVEGGILVLSLVYFYFPKYGGVYWFKGPVPTIADASDESSSLEKKDAGVIEAEV